MVKCLTVPANISQVQSYLSKGSWDGGWSPLFSLGSPSTFPRWRKKSEVDESGSDLVWFPFKCKTELKLSKDCVVFIYGINSNIRILLTGKTSRSVPKWQTSQYQNNSQNIKSLLLLPDPRQTGVQARKQISALSVRYPKLLILVSGLGIQILLH